LGIDPDLLIAQASLETGWGKKMQGKNLFNIKAGKGWSGSSTKQNTTEYYNGQAVRVSDKFRRYQSYEDAFGDYLKLVVLNPRYQQALNHGGDAYTYIKGLQQAGYATDPKYADKVFSIYRSIKSI
jgi:flagellar protein FlgJ